MKNEETQKHPDDIRKDRPSAIRRRDFFRILGGGIILFFSPPDLLGFSAIPAEQGRSLTKDYNAFLHIAEDGTVTCYTGKIEMGQGVITSLPQMMADELNVPLERVRIVMGDTDLCPWDAGTWGSLTTRVFGPAMRAAAAEARVVLVGMAAAKLGVSESQLEVKDGVISDTHKPHGRVTYAELAKGKKLEKYLDIKPSVEDHAAFTLVGKPLYRSDAREKVTGRAIYAGDIKMPGMLYARILRPPSHGAKLLSADVSEAEKADGVKVVREKDFIAVLHEDIEKAGEILKLIKAEYSFDEMKVNNQTMFDWIVKAETASSVTASGGDPDAARKQSEFLFENEYHDVYCAHSPIETHTALAFMEGDKLIVWASTQSPFGLQDGIVRELGLPLENVRVRTPFVGGGFGGKSAYQQGIEAARLTKITGSPVMVAWTREEEFFFDIFHPASVIRLSSGMDSTGKILFWDYNVWLAGTRGAEVTYDIPNFRTTSYSRKRGGPAVHPFNTGPWRAPNNNTNTFARETQIDIMAARAGTDPLEFRLKNLKDEKLIGCLKAAAEKFGYTPAVSPSGRGVGIACGADAGTSVAMITEIKADRKTGAVKVVRVICAQDMGLCVNPQGALIQMEGCITMGLGYTLTEEVMFEGGKVITSGFDSYEIPRFSWLPEIGCIILDRKGMPPQGGGEPAIITVGASVGNAIFDATGARMLMMPFTKERILKALNKG